MKVVSIGRSPENMIIIDDMMVSRRHAIIRISPLGKYELVSLGSNGTKVNGNQVAPNVPYPIKRGDSVIFANVAPMNWSRVPDPLRPYKIGLISLCVALIAIFAVIAVVKLVGSTVSESEPTENVNPSSTDSTDSVQSPNIKLSEDSKETETDDNVIPIEQRLKANNQTDKKNNRHDSQHKSQPNTKQSNDTLTQEKQSEENPQPKEPVDSLPNKNFRR